MNLKRAQFADAVAHTVRDLCSVVFNIKSDEQMEKIFCMTHAQLDNAVKQIINALPADVFEQPKLLEEIQNIIAREFIFFQAQEKCNDPHYQEDLSTFIGIFSRDIKQRINAFSDSKSKMREE